MALTFEQHLKLAAGLGRLLVQDASDVAALAADVPRLVRLGGRVASLIQSVAQPAAFPDGTKPPSPAVTLPAPEAAARIEQHGLSASEQQAFDRASRSDNGGA